MKETKIEAITKLFEGNKIRSIWDKEKEDYYFSVVDIIGVLTESKDSRKYWSVLKLRLKKEGSELITNCSQLKIKAKDGKYYSTDVLDTEGIFRLIESVPSKKAEPLKLWLAKLGRQEVDNVFDPSKGIDKMIDYYLRKGYTLEWIEVKIKAVLNRKKLISKKNKIKKEYEYGILANEIYKTWSGISASDYKKYKEKRKESLRDNVANLGEVATKEFAKKHKLKGLYENRIITKNTRNNIENELGDSIVVSSNNLGKKYLK